MLYSLGLPGSSRLVDFQHSAARQQNIADLILAGVDGHQYRRLALLILRIDQGWLSVQQRAHRAAITGANYREQLVDLRHERSWFKKGTAMKILRCAGCLCGMLAPI